LCHSLPLSSVTVDFEEVGDNALKITAIAKTFYQTGVEMEALTAVSVAALTIYDMAKAIDKGMQIGEIHLVHKEGGKSGVFDKDKSK
jgi:cyclic pyranopterin phosphate synthase